MTRFKNLIALFFLLCCFWPPGVSGQSMTVYPTTAVRGQKTSFLVSGVATTFSTATGYYIPNPGANWPYYGALPRHTFSNTLAEVEIEIPVTANLGSSFIWSDGWWPFIQTSAAVTVVDPPTGAGRIAGSVLQRNATGCFAGTGMANQVLEFLPGPHYAYTNFVGDYEIWLPVGNYTVELLNQPAWHSQMCPNTPFAVNISAPGQNYPGRDFYLLQQNVVDLSVDVIANPHRPGFVTGNYLQVRNLGSATASNITVVAVIDSALTFNSGFPMPASFQNDSIIWNIASLPGNSTQQLNFSITTPVYAFGWPLTYRAQVTTSSQDQYLGNNSEEIIVPVTGSYDPNDKQVWTQDNVNADGPINPTDSLLRYMVRFQNTGTDTAFNIFIRDTLSPLLDPGSLDVLHASHSFVYSVSNGNQVEFYFPNVLLPDSNINEPLSHGYIEFEARPVPNLGLGTEIDNTASIYFDFNAPVVTNTVSSKICPEVSLDFNISASLLNIGINNLSTGSLGAVSWDFGDGNSSSAFSPSHTYQMAGEYNVCLRVTDTCGVRSLCKRVRVSCAPEPATFSHASTGLTTQFTDATQGNVTSWYWTFGDGNFSSVQNPQHTYAQPGIYQVCLITGSDCGSDTTCQTLGLVGIDLAEAISLEIFPNPSAGNFWLQADFGQLGLLSWQVYDLAGRELFARQVGAVQGKFRQQLDLSSLAEGTYMLQLNLNGQKLNRLLTVSK